MKSRYEIGKLLRNNQAFIENNFNAWQVRTLMALARCRTAALGGHIDKCNHKSCGKIHLSYNSCRNRHCPKCQGHQREQWIAKREEDLLDTGYFHVVFTLPSELHRLALHKPKIVYGSLFKAAWSTLKGFGDNPKFLGAKMGMIAVLHTWGQNLSLHPHLHCIVPNGGLTKTGKWKKSKGKGDFLFPVKEVSKVFRAKYVSLLRKQGIKEKTLLNKLFDKPWVVYTKKPFDSPSLVVEYLGRYSHKVAISNHRLIKITPKEVVFSAKNYRNNGEKQTLSLSPKEFIRRFALHVLPKGFVRIRHYGFLSSSGKKKDLPRLKKLVGKPKLKARSENKHLLCPKCKKGRLEIVCSFDTRGPPKRWINRLTTSNSSY